MEKTDGLKKLREPFPENQISKLPKESRKQIDERKSGKNIVWKCEICGGMHHKDAVHLDYVGHAALTDRLLDCDPEWNWEFAATQENGLPVLDESGGFWIKLTVCGVTRLGYGDAQGKVGGDAMKERIGDALRNAAMRFGAALDLWHKGDLHAEDPILYTQGQKDTMNLLIAENNALGMVAFMASLSEEVQTDLFNSFDKGAKSSGKNTIRELNKEGIEQWKSLEADVIAMIESNDGFGLIEATSELTDGEKRHLMRLIGDKNVQALKTLISEAKQAA